MVPPEQKLPVQVAGLNGVQVDLQAQAGMPLLIP